MGTKLRDEEHKNEVQRIELIASKREMELLVTITELEHEIISLTKSNSSMQSMKLELDAFRKRNQRLTKENEAFRNTRTAKVVTVESKEKLEEIKRLKALLEEKDVKIKALLTEKDHKIKSLNSWVETNGQCPSEMDLFAVTASSSNCG